MINYLVSTKEAAQCFKKCLSWMESQNDVVVFLIFYLFILFYNNTTYKTTYNNTTYKKKVKNIYIYSTQNDVDAVQLMQLRCMMDFAMRSTYFETNKHA